MGTDELFSADPGAPTLLARSRDHALLLADAPPLPTGYSVGNALTQQWLAALHHEELSRRAAARAAVQAAADAAEAEAARAAAASPKRGGGKKAGGKAPLVKASSKSSLAATSTETELPEPPAELPTMPPMYTHDDVVAAFGVDLAKSPAAGVFRNQNTTVAIAELQCQHDVPLAAYSDDDFGAFAQLWKAVLLSDVPPQEVVTLQASTGQVEGGFNGAASSDGDAADDVQLHSTPTPRATGSAKAMAIERTPPGGDSAGDGGGTVRPQSSGTPPPARWCQVPSCLLRWGGHFNCCSQRTPSLLLSTAGWRCMV